MSRINDFSFLFKEPSEAHRVAPCGWVCVGEGGEKRSVCMKWRKCHNVHA